MRRQTTLDPPGRDDIRSTSVASAPRPLNGATNNNRRRRSKGTSSSSSSMLSTRTTPISMIGTVFILLMMFWILIASYFYRNTITTRKSSSNVDASLSQPVMRQLVNEPSKKQIVASPYDGWQPLDYVDKNADDCSSWRKCFADKHGCPGRCRDSKLDIEDEVSMPHRFDDTTWVPDVEMLHRMLLQGHDSQGRPWPPALVTPTNKELCENIGTFGGQGDENIVLFDAVPLEASPLVLSGEEQQEALQKSITDGGSRLPRILCMVYTMESEHATRIRAIRETWAPGCDGFLAFSTKSDPRIPAISLPHEGPEAYENMWQKVRSIWAFVGKHYLDDFDFFFQGGDDLFVLPQNLRLYLSRTVANPDQDDFFGGRRFKSGKTDYFNSGGAGYVLSRATLRKFVKEGLESKICNAHLKTSMEDLMIARCLRMQFGIGLVDTRDEKERERFHPFSPGNHFTWKPPVPPKTDWYEQYNREWPPKLGKDCCAPDSVSFHYIKKAAMVRHLHSLLYFCKDPARTE
mmetsp:Transcript_33040/g.80303  ORF Transcript_33040/g.80303 Transcript_33040/m.80303 type:complete len:518 (+) Transcript_33040:124-1677(+)